MEIIFTAPKMYHMFLRDAGLESALRQVAGRSVRVKLKEGVAKSAPAAQPASSGASTDELDQGATERAMAHPEVQRFKELFPDAEVRQVRNLKETGI